jgi:hypothetical protein
MSISFDGPMQKFNDCEAERPGHGGGSTPFDGASPPCSRTGTCCLPPHAGLWEPYDGRPSRTVLRGREGEAPSRYSPGLDEVRPVRQYRVQVGQLSGHPVKATRPNRTRGLHAQVRIPTARAVYRVGVRRKLGV